MTMPARMNGELLHLWLCLLGWQIETGRDGDYAVGVGTHVPAEGSTLRVGGCARSDGELALQLFEQAMLTYARVYDAAHDELTAAQPPEVDRGCDGSSFDPAAASVPAA